MSQPQSGKSPRNSCYSMVTGTQRKHTGPEGWAGLDKKNPELLVSVLSDKGADRATGGVGTLSNKSRGGKKGFPLAIGGTV